MRFAPLLLTVFALSLGGCSTFQGLKNDVSSGLNAIGDTVGRVIKPDPVKEAKKKLPVYDGTCPTVTVRPDLRRLVEFYDPDKPSDSKKISEVTIVHVQNTCRVEGDKLVMQIDLSLSGKTGPKARVKPTDKPSFVYPYLVAVTDDKGVVLAKDIFAASMVYGANQNDLAYTESVFQTMPFPDAASGQIYNVVVGFQLTPEQLAYNTANPPPPLNQ